MANSPPLPRGDLTEGSVRRSLLAMSAPMAIGLAALMSVNTVDTFFVGQLGVPQLAAMGYCLPIMFLAMALATGIGSGVQSVVSRAVGATDFATARRVAFQGILLSLLLTGALVSGGQLWFREIFEALGADSTTMPHIEAYMRVWLYALFFFVGPMVAGSAFMARGDAKTPAAFLIGGAVLNGVLDPFLIFGLGPFPELGMTGAALASAIARGIISVATVRAIWNDEILRPTRADLYRGLGANWAAILRVGLPVTLVAAIYPGTQAVVTRILSEFGDPVVAAFGAGARIDALALVVSVAVGMGLAPIVGQNWGAGLRERVLEGLGLGERISVAWGALVWLALAGCSAVIAPAFVVGEEAADILRDYLIVAPLGYAGLGVIAVCRQALHAVDRASHSTVISVAQALLLSGTVIIVARDGAIWLVFLSIAAVHLVVAGGTSLHVHRLLRRSPLG